MALTHCVAGLIARWKQSIVLGILSGVVVGFATQRGSLPVPRSH
jgi:hypothetical protein